MAPVSESSKLRGKSNYISWKRMFVREAKTEDVWDYLDGTEGIPNKPVLTEFENDIEFRANRQARQTMSPGGSETDPGEQEFMSVRSNNFLKYQIKYNEWKNAVDKNKVAKKLLMSWIDESIGMEVEDKHLASEAYEYIMEQYSVADDRARNELLNEMTNLKLQDVGTVGKYYSKFRQLQADLKAVDFDVTTEMIVTSANNGLPDSYKDFKSKWAWFREFDPDKKIDLPTYFNRLQAEEEDQKKIKEEKKSQDNKNKKSEGRPFSNRASSQNKVDKSNRVCTFAACPNKTGHTEDYCWAKHPDKMPANVRKARDINQRNAKAKDGVAAVAGTDEEAFHAAMEAARINSLGMSFSAPPNRHVSDSVQQKPSCRENQGGHAPGLGGDDTGGCKDDETTLLGCSRKVLNALTVGTGAQCTKDTWLADTGANIHVVNDRKWFEPTSFQSFDLDISTANDMDALHIEGGGKVQLVLISSEGHRVIVTLTNAAYAPSAKCNLFSGGKFVLLGRLTGVYDDHHMSWYTEAGQEVGFASYEDGLYHLRAEQLQPAIPAQEVSVAQDLEANMEHLVVAAVNFDDPVWAMHRRLGHLSLQRMLELLEVSEGMGLTAKQIRAKLKTICPVCAITKAVVNIPREPARRRADLPGQVFHADGWGPYPKTGFDGTRYFLFLTDDATRYTWSARYDTPGQLFDVFTQLHEYIEKRYGFNIRFYRWDNEFEDGPIGKWCKRKAIGSEPIEPYAHYQNGVAERVNRTIRERAAPMVQEPTLSGQVSKIVVGRGTEMLRLTSIPENLFPEAIQHAVYLKNRSTSRALKRREKKTPWEALKDIKPRIGNERVWGSRAYVSYPREFRTRASMTKLHSARGRLGYFVGCESEAMQRIYFPDTHTVERIGVARIKDDEGMDDPHDAPAYADRVPTPVIDLISDDSSDEEDEDVQLSRREDQILPDRDRDPVSESREPRIPAAGNNSYKEPADSSGEEEGIDLDDSDDDGPPVTSKFFPVAPRAAVAKKRRREDDDSFNNEQNGDPVIAPVGTRKATHDLKGVQAEDTEGVSQFTYNRRYFTDDTKCDHCFRYGYKCDRDEVGTPCTRCKKSHSVCRDQTKFSKSLIKEEDQQTTLSIEPMQPQVKCRRCTTNMRRCVVSGPGTDCDKCVAEKRNCNWNLEGVEAAMNKKRDDRHAAQLEARQQKLIEKHGFIPASFEEKCLQCQKRNKLCNGEIPCNNCQSWATRGKCVLAKDAHDRVDMPACNRCKNLNCENACTKGMPCTSCVNKGMGCKHTYQEGLLVRTYTDCGKLTRPMTAVKLPALGKDDPADEACTTCIAKGIQCSGDQPCSECRASPKNPKYCCWRLPAGAYEEYFTWAFDGTAGVPELRDNWEKFLGMTRGDYLHWQNTGEFKCSTNLDKDTIDDPEATRERLDMLHESAKKKLKPFNFTGLAAILDDKCPYTLDFSSEPKYAASKMAEFQSHLDKGTWTVERLPVGEKAITSRWVNTDKYNPDGTLARHKSRLVARGFQQEEGIDFEETFASVVKPTSTRILLAIACVKGWDVHTGDVQVAFLNSNLSKAVAVKPPKGVTLPKGYILMVIKALYGLKQSPRAWYRKFADTLRNWGWRVSAYDACVFINDITGLILEVHVDDINVMGADLQAVLDFKAQLSSEFKMTDGGKCSWYLGMHIDQEPGVTTIHQRKYIDDILAKYGFTNAAPASTPLDRTKLRKAEDYEAPAKFKKDYQSKVGSLNFAANQTRVDIAFATGYVARYMSNPDQSHMDAVSRIFAYLQGDPGRGIKYMATYGIDPKVYIDSDHGGCEDSKRSTTGWVVTMAGAPVSWASQRQKTVATSTMDAEYVAAAEAAKEAVWVRGFVNDLRIPGVKIDKIPVFIDNNSALKLTKNPESHQKSKHIDIKHHFIREKVEEGVIDTKRVSTRDNIADILTKPLPRDVHAHQLEQMNIVSGGVAMAADSKNVSNKRFALVDKHKRSRQQQEKFNKTTDPEDRRKTEIETEKKKEKEREREKERDRDGDRDRGVS